MIVLKLGGAAGIQDEPIVEDIARLWEDGEQVILVHGGSETLNQVSKDLGHPPRFVTSPSGHQSRVTDRKTLEIFTMVYCGARNKALVEKLQKAGVQAVGLSGIDGRIFEGRRKPKIRYVENGKTKVLRNDFTGKVETLNTDLLQLLLENGYMPVLTPPAISTESEAINVDGDRAAALVASSFRSESLVILSNVPGLLKDLEDPESLVPEVFVEDLDEAMQFAGGRMKKKLLGAAEAVEAGVERVILASANRENPFARALQGEGTVVRRRTPRGAPHAV